MAYHNPSEHNPLLMQLMQRGGQAGPMAQGQMQGLPQNQAGGGRSAQMNAGRIAQRRAELMAKGLTTEQALQQMANEGLIDPRLVERMLRMPRAAGAAFPQAQGGLPPTGNLPPVGNLPR